ncbi:MAG: LysR family transcriptional regulator, partial [Pseudomonadota bacterium]
MQWFEKLQVHPRIVGEFDDGALLKAFGQVGVGIFAAPSAIAKEVRLQYGVVAMGHTSAVTEQFYTISVERRLSHPAVVAISAAARTELFGKRRGN